jgi:hypothetical protein
MKKAFSMSDVKLIRAMEFSFSNYTQNQSQEVTMNFSFPETPIDKLKLKIK